MQLSAIVRGFGDLQYILSFSVAFLVDIRVGSVITGKRYNFATVSHNC